MTRWIAASLLAPALGFLPGLMDARTFAVKKGLPLETEWIADKDKQVTLRKANGQQLSLALSEISESDRAFILNWAKGATALLPEEAPAPGSTLKFEFPDLPKDFRGNPAAFSVKIPSGYSPDEPVPLMIFLGGGAGGNNPGGALALTRDDFVCTALPYPDNGRNPMQHNMVGDFDKVWEYWQPMLAKLDEAIPNLDPTLRVIGGFSNGAHAIDGLLAREEFSSYFTAFILIDGGGALPSRYRNVAGKHCYVAWGTQSPAVRSCAEVVNRAHRARMKVKASPMEGVGHAFPGLEKKRIKEWLYSVVIRR